jgi:hypothetical protein
MKIWKRVLQIFQKEGKQTDIELSPKREKRPLGFQRELEELQKKWKDFLLTAKVKTGLVIQRNHYSLQKTGNYLYKLEGKDKSGQDFSIIINTGNFLSQKDGKITGFLQVSETELNKAIQREHNSLEHILNEFPQLYLEEKSFEVLGRDRGKFNWKEILFWETFWKEQVIRKLRPNYLAILLVSLDPSFQKLFLEYATRKQKKIISDELFFLNQGVNKEDSNPNSKNYDLTSTAQALKEFQRIIETLKKKREKEA